ncbi:hypothetical protein [Oceanobacillus senegalensis]|uniref:hypothetical protein n=1 Tax=Oceanobacillus senegalensis TaxID=1936063 RepID=UPI001C4FCE4E|nr:hypothetical protein [Oceanobacillus senegalensis]
MAIIAYVKGYENFASQGLGNSTGLLMYYHFVNNYFVIALSALLWSFIYSKENSYNTWSILLTKIPYKFYLISAKSIAFIIYYVFSVVISHILLLVFCFMQKVELISQSFISSVLISLFTVLSIGFLQFILHVVFKNGLIAASLSLVWIVLLFLYTFFPKFVQYLFPLFLSTTVIDASKLQGLSIVIVSAIGSLLFIFLTVLLSSKVNLSKMD